MKILIKILILSSVLIYCKPLLAQTETKKAKINAIKPKKPYRVWYQPGLIENNPELYSNMNMDAGGTVKPSFGLKHGITTLGWAYGPNHPDSFTGQYYVDVMHPGYCSEKIGDGPLKGKTLFRAGIAVDEWLIRYSSPKTKTTMEGLRLARKKYPDRFITVWFTQPSQELFDLVKEGTVDLIIYEGYTFREAPWKTITMEDEKTRWDRHISHCEIAKKAGVLDKMIFGFGHINGSDKAKDGSVLDIRQLEKRIREIKKRYPEMPGVAFYQANGTDTPRNRKVISLCNRLSKELWPDIEGQTEKKMQSRDSIDMDCK